MITEQDFMRDYWRQKSQEYRARLAKKSKCPRCQKPCTEGTRWHRACLDKHNARRAERKASRK